MDESSSNGPSSVPVPKPRRHIIQIDANLNNKTSYENVSIDLINKNINIKNENLQNNSKNKLQANKLFIMPTNSPTPAPSNSSHCQNDDRNIATAMLTKLNDLQNISNNNNNKNTSNSLDEVNKLSNIYNDDENTKVIPVPAPRRSTVLQTSASTSKVENSSQSINKITCSPSTGAISKQPSKSNKFKEESMTVPVKNGKNSGSYSFVSDDFDSGNGDHFTTTFSMRKTLSNSSLGSSQSGSSNADAAASKYHTNSPGQLLKALGATSKMLSESITERVTTRTKDAKHKIDKIHKSSRDRIAETTKSATSKLKTVRKNIHDTIELTQNLSLGRNKTKANNSSSKSGSGAAAVPAFDADRPQTVPANDDLFQSISFHSPLNSKTNNCMNINTADESSYQIPKNIRSFSSDSSSLSDGRNAVSFSSRHLPPSYEDIMKENSTKSIATNEFIKSNNSLRPNPTARNRSKNKINSNSYENHEITITVSKPAAKCDSNKAESISSNSTDDDEYAVPCPNFPAPVLSESIYGKIRPNASHQQDFTDGGDASASSSASIQAPIRSKRRKDYEHMELRKKIEDLASNRATADSAEFQLDDKFSKILAREVSEDFTDKLQMQEKSIPRADRSDSWSYYDVNSDEKSDELSSPEPIYENEQTINRPRGSVISEPLYGVLYNASDSPESTLLTPVAVARKRRSEERTSAQNSAINKSAEIKLRNDDTDCAPDILKEFDPLDRKTLDKLLANKSNELILLENLLGEETYKNCTEENNFDYSSVETSDNEESDGIPTPPERLDSLKEAADEDINDVCIRTAKNQSDPDHDNRKTEIIHQNMSLRSDSIENLIENLTAEGSSSASPTAEDKTGKTTNSRWFLNSTNESENKSKLKADKKANIKSIKDDKCPLPSYNEAIGIDEELKASNLSTSASSEKRASSTKSSMFSMLSNVMHKVEGITRKTSFRSSAAKVEVKTVLEMVPRPCLTQRLTLHEGHLIRLPTGVVEDILKELHSRKAYIRDKKFQAYFDKEPKTPKENIPLEWITTIQCVNNHKCSNSFVDIYCFEITTAIPKNVGNNLSNPNMVITTNNSGNTKTQRVCHLYGVAKESERFIWMQKLLDSLTDVFPPGFSCRFYRAGWCYSKNSISSSWSGTWILLQKEKRRLLFYNYLNMNLECMDLRKARCLVLKESDDSIKNLHVEAGPTLMVDCPPYTMYFIMTSPRETKIWRHIIQEVAHNNGPSLKEQQLTKDNVPVLVDKCINFIYAHGSMSEGIYRKSGSENSIQKLLKIFRTDAYSAQIIRCDYNEHDVANALKRFMRDLPDRLLGRYTTSLISVSEMKEIRDKIDAYKELLTRLPSIEYHTLRKLLGHLHFIQSQKARNKMDVANLAIVWGPTLLQDQQSEGHYSQKTAEVIIDLIKFYKNLYALSAEEVTKEQIMLTVLQKYHAAAENLSDSMKKSGDLKVWITIDPNPDNESEEKQQINVTLTPNKTVYEICKELAPKIKREAFAVTLSEIILNDTLQRPLHHSEKVFDIVLKWSYWPEADRKNNYLRLRPMKFMKEVERALKVLPSVSPNKELKFADCRTKALKSYTLELSDGKITVMKKEKSTIVKVREIDLMHSTAYLGCEKKRDFQLRWAITLIEADIANKSNLRTRESPFIGHVIAGTNSNDQVVWYSSILHSLYGDDIMPSPEIVIP